MGWFKKSLKTVLSGGVSKIADKIVENQSSNTLAKAGKAIVTPLQSENTAKSLLTGAGSDVYNALKRKGGSSVVDQLNTALDPGGVVQETTRGLGSVTVPKEVKPMAPMVGAYLGNMIGGPGGAAAGAKVGGDLAGVSNEQSARNAGMAALTTWAMGALEDYLSNADWSFGEGGEGSGGSEGLDQHPIHTIDDSVTPPAEGAGTTANAETGDIPLEESPAYEGKPLENKGSSLLGDAVKTGKAGYDLYNAYKLLSNKPDMPGDFTPPPEWEEMTELEKSKWLLIHGGEAGKKGSRYAGEIGSIRGGTDNTYLGRALLTGDTRKPSLLG